LEEWHHYLKGSSHTIKILSNHKNLEIFREMCKLSRRQTRWVLYLSKFDFQITHTPSKNAGKPDALSRQPDHEEGDHDNEDCILLPATLFTKQITTEIVNTEYQQHIKDCQQLDNEVLTILQCLQAPRPGILQSLLKEEWSVKGGIVLKNGHTSMFQKILI